MKKIIINFFILGTPLMVCAENLSGRNVTSNVNVNGVIANVSFGMTGSSSNAKQAIGSLLYGELSGDVTSSVKLKGAAINVGTSMYGGKAFSCQSLGTLGTDCKKNSFELGFFGFGGN